MLRSHVRTRLKKMSWWAVLVLALVLALTGTGQAGSAPVLTPSGASPTYRIGGASVPVDPNITLTGGETFSGGTVAITGGFESTDRLSYTQVGPVVGSYNTATGVLTLSGSGTAAQYQAAFRAVRFESIATTPSESPRTVTFTIGGGSLYYVGTGHYYEFVSASRITWQSAASAAGARLLYGMRGYLATITSAEENAFIAGKVNQNGWIGASDAAVEGTWKWVTGPENGTVFTYTNWAPGEPNNAGWWGEDHGHMYANSGMWNDFYYSDPAIGGYIVEYGGMPGEPTPSLSAAVTVAVIDRDDPPVLVVFGSATYAENDTPVLVAPGLSVSDVDGGAIKGAKVSIGAGFVPAQDRLGLQGQAGTAGTVEGLAWSYNTGSGVLTFSGSAGASTYEAALRQVTYQNLSETPAVEARSIDFSLGDNSLYYPGTGHYYEFVSATRTTWSAAKSAAEARSLYGMRGYLATITAADENAFIAGKVRQNGWIGASDATAEGTWKWVTGPENGMIFCTGGKPCTPYNGRYVNWDNGEPNNYPVYGPEGEDYGHMIASNGRWNDFPNYSGSIYGYIVEYGGMPDDPELQLTGSISLNVLPVNDPPVLQAIAPRSLSEGSATVITGISATDIDTPLELVSAAVSSGDPARASATIAGSGGDWTITLSGLDGPAEVPITVEVSDGQDAATTVFLLTVQNAPPIVTAEQRSATVDEGQTLSSTITFTDPGTDTWTARVHYGDGSEIQTFNLEDRSFALSHLYSQNGSYVVSVTVTDDDGSSGSAEISVTVLNVAPEVALHGGTADEGSAFIESGTFTDPGADTWTATVDYGDGSGPEPLALDGTAFALHHVYADDGTYTVTVTVTDSDGGVGSSTADVIVRNVAPTVNAGPDLRSYSGLSALVNTTFTDPSLVDTHTATVDWGDGSLPEPVSVAQGTGSGSLSASHLYLLPAVYPVTVCVTDDDGLTGCDEALIDLRPLPVTINVTPDETPNSVNLKSKGNIPVGLLSGVYNGIAFDATQVDFNSVTFAGAPNLLIGEGPVDLNGDGLLDMVFHFEVQQTSLTSFSTSGTLTGITSDGIWFEGTDSVRIIGK